MISSEIERHIETAYRNRHRGEAAVIFGRSPWVLRDYEMLNGIVTKNIVAAAVRIGVNYSADRFHCRYCCASDIRLFHKYHPSRHPDVVFFMCGGDEQTKAARDIRTKNIVLWNPEPGPFFTAHPLPRPVRPFKETSGHTALWLAYYMGCDPIYLLGMQFTLKKIGEKVQYSIDEDDPDRIGEKAERLPGQRESFGAAVRLLRGNGTKVVWPGEKGAPDA